MVFPKPLPTYNKNHPLLYYIPKTKPQGNKDKIPILFYSNLDQA